MHRLVGHIILLLTLLLCNSYAFGSNGDFNKSFYYRWTHLSDSMLIVRGNDFLIHRGQTDSALVCYSVLADRYTNGHRDSVSLSYYTKAFHNLQIIYTYYIYDYKRATESIVQAERIAADYGLNELLPRIYLGEASLYLMALQLDKGSELAGLVLDNYRKAFDAAQKIGDNQQLVLTAINMTEFANSNKVWPDVKPYISRFLKMRLSKLPLAQFAVAYCQAYMSLNDGDYEQAYAMFKSLQTLIDETQNHDRCEMMAMGGMGEALQMKGDIVGAIECYKEMETKSKRSTATDVLLGVYRGLNKLYSLLGDSAMARHYNDLEMHIRDSLYTQAHIEAIKNMPLLQRLSAMSVEAQKAAKRQHMLRIILVVLVIVLILTSIGGLIIARLYRWQCLHNHELYERYQTLLRQDEERKRKEKTHQKPLRTVTATEAEDLAVRIRYVMDHNTEVYQPDFTVRILAELVDAKYWEVSQAINDHFHKNFSRLLVDYRIKEVCHRLADKKNYNNMTIEAIAASVGFKSRTNFGKVFKEVTGLSPSAYVNELKKA